MIITTIPKGTKDTLPQNSYKWQYVEQIARNVCSLFNVKEIRTPIFEHTELFLRSIGEQTDVVSKEMYTFNDKGGRSITLKPEGTASVGRSFIENSLEHGGLPLKMFYFTPVFRYEKPQAGRLREHHQFGVEMYGSPSPFLDAEVISLAYKFLTDLGIGGLSLSLNSIGCNKCRGAYNEALKSYLRANSDNLCDTCKTRLENNPLRTLDCKEEGCKKILKNAPKILDYICDDCSSHMAILIERLHALNIPYVIDSSIVRGLDYYTKTVFEFTTNLLGSQGTVCGGGRYDGLVESLGGKPTPCVGFGLGLERLIMLLEALGLGAGDANKVDVCLINQAENALSYCSNLANDLRLLGVSVDYDFMSRSMKAQFKYAEKINPTYVIVVGEAEMQSGKFSLKRQSDGKIFECSLNELSNFLKN